MSNFFENIDAWWTFNNTLEDYSQNNNAIKNYKKITDQQETTNFVDSTFGFKLTDRSIMYHKQLVLNKPFICSNPLMKNYNDFFISMNLKINQIKPEQCLVHQFTQSSDILKISILQNTTIKVVYCSQEYSQNINIPSQYFNLQLHITDKLRLYIDGQLGFEQSVTQQTLPVSYFGLGQKFNSLYETDQTTVQDCSVFDVKIFSRKSNNKEILDIAKKSEYTIKNTTDKGLVISPFVVITKEMYEPIQEKQTTFFVSSESYNENSNAVNCTEKYKTFLNRYQFNDLTINYNLYQQQPQNPQYGYKRILNDDPAITYIGNWENDTTQYSGKKSSIIKKTTDKTSQFNNITNYGQSFKFNFTGQSIQLQFVHKATSTHFCVLIDDFFYNEFTTSGNENSSNICVIINDLANEEHDIEVLRMDNNYELYFDFAEINFLSELSNYKNNNCYTVSYMDKNGYAPNWFDVYNSKNSSVYGLYTHKSYGIFSIDEAIKTSIYSNLNYTKKEKKQIVYSPLISNVKTSRNNTLITDKSESFQSIGYNLRKEETMQNTNLYTMMIEKKKHSTKYCYKHRPNGRWITSCQGYGMEVFNFSVQFATKHNYNKKRVICQFGDISDLQIYITEDNYLQFKDSQETKLQQIDNNTTTFASFCFDKTQNKTVCLLNGEKIYEGNCIVLVKPYMYIGSDQNLENHFEGQLQQIKFDKKKDINLCFDNYKQYRKKLNDEQYKINDFSVCNNNAQYCLSKFIYNNYQRTSIQTSDNGFSEALTPLKDITVQKAQLINGEHIQIDNSYNKDLQIKGKFIFNNAMTQQISVRVESSWGCYQQYVEVIGEYNTGMTLTLTERVGEEYSENDTVIQTGECIQNNVIILDYNNLSSQKKYDLTFKATAQQNCQINLLRIVYYNAEPSQFQSGNQYRFSLGEATSEKQIKKININSKKWTMLFWTFNPKKSNFLLRLMNKKLSDRELYWYNVSPLHLIRLEKYKDNTWFEVTRKDTQTSNNKISYTPVIQNTTTGWTLYQITYNPETKTLKLYINGIEKQEILPEQTEQQFLVSEDMEFKYIVVYSDLCSYPVFIPKILSQAEIEYIFQNNL